MLKFQGTVKLYSEFFIGSPPGSASPPPLRHSAKWSIPFLSFCRLIFVFFCIVCLRTKKSWSAKRNEAKVVRRKRVFLQLYSERGHPKSKDATMQQLRPSLDLCHFMLEMSWFDLTAFACSFSLVGDRFSINTNWNNRLHQLGYKCF